MGEIYGSKGSSQFGLQYEDSEGDNVMLTNEDDYKAMLDSESDRNSIKIFILAGDDGSNDEKVDPEDDEELKRQAEIEAEEKARREAMISEEKAMKEAEGMARKEAEEKARQEEIERARREAEIQAEE